MYDDIEDLIKIFDLFVNQLKFFSSSFDMQYERFKRDDIASDIANELGSIGVERAKILNKHEWITNEQYELVQQIDHKLDKMSANKNLWSNRALQNSKEWEECKKMVKYLLNSLGY